MEQAEQRLHEIGISVAAKEERLAVILKALDEKSAELLTRQQELATANEGLAKYRATVAAL